MDRAYRLKRARAEASWIFRAVCNTATHDRVWERSRANALGLCCATLFGCSGSVGTEIATGAPLVSNPTDSAAMPAATMNATAPPVIGSDSAVPTPSVTTTVMDAITIGCDEIRAESRSIIEGSCAECHADGNRAGNFDYVLDTPRLIGTGRLVPGAVDESPLFARVAAGTMPPPGFMPRPDESQIAVLSRWIEECLPTTLDPALPPPSATDPSQAASCATPFIDKQEMLAAMTADISGIDLDDRPFVRYFTFTHLHNAGLCTEDLDVYRFALGKAVNATSQGTWVIPPVAIDALQTIYRIDLRDYEWEGTATRQDRWELLVQSNPYAVRLAQNDAEVLQSFTQTLVPFQAGDWFVNAGTQPPLYYDLLAIPPSVPELETMLGVDIGADILAGDVWRAGFLNSGVSAQNRIIERHILPVSNARTLWVSYDFAGNGGRENIFANPLDFEADGSEIIFTLPNGLQAFMVANSSGERLDVAPSNIVVDPEQEDDNVRAGVSCFSCHGAGYNGKRDELRDFVLGSTDFSQRTKDQVADLYAPRSEFDAFLERDRSVFQAALGELNPPASVVTDPIVTVFQAFDANVSLERAAAELGLPTATLLRELGGLDPSLAPLGQPFGTVKRETFRDAFAQTVCILNLGFTSDPACGQP